MHYYGSGAMVATATATTAASTGSVGSIATTTPVVDDLAADCYCPEATSCDPLTPEQDWEDPTESLLFASTELFLLQKRPTKSLVLTLKDRESDLNLQFG